MEYINSPQYSGLPMDIVSNQPQMQYPQQQIMNNNNQMIQPQTPSIKIADTPHKPMFTVVKDSSDQKGVIKIEDAPVEEKKRRGRPPKAMHDTEIVKPKGSNTSDIENLPTSYTYEETTSMLHDTLGQIDAINSELVKEFEEVKHNRTMKNKYSTMVGLTENIGSLINNRIQVIKEINNSISKSNDLDYKKYKDMKAANAVVNDDKYVADLYQAYLNNPQSQIPTPQLPPVDTSLYGSGIVRADVHSGDISTSGPIDAGYMAYVANLTPEQNLMRYEDNPNVKQVVIYDASTGGKSFQVMDMSTGQVIPNVPVYDQMFMEDTTIDLKSKTAKNLNLKETFPVVVINEGVTSQY